MLVISRRIHDSFFMDYKGEQVEVKIIDVCRRTKTVLVGIDSTTDVKIWRDDIKNKEIKINGNNKTSS